MFDLTDTQSAALLLVLGTLAGMTLAGLIETAWRKRRG